MSATEIRFPEVTVNLSITDGNVFAVIATVRKAIKDHMRATGRTSAEIQDTTTEFVDAATSRDYDDAIQTCMNWVNVI